VVCRKREPAPVEELTRELQTAALRFTMSGGETLELR